MLLEELNGSKLLGFDGVNGDIKGVGDFFDAFVLKVKEVEDLAGTGRQLIEQGIEPMNDFRLDDVFESRVFDG